MSGEDFDAGCRDLIALYHRARFAELIEAGEAMARLHPGQPAPINLVGAAHASLGQLDQAVAAYVRALEIDPGSSDVLNNLGAALRRLGRLDEAEQHHRRALAIDPSNAAALNNLGSALREQGRLGEALECYKGAAAMRPDLFEPHRNLANMLIDAGDPAAALACFDRALQVRPGDDYCRAQRLHLLARFCEWNAIADETAHIPALGICGSAVSPFTLMALDDSPERHRRRAERYVSERIPPSPRRPFPVPHRRPDRLRIGYFSADFHDHATMQLIAGVIERHDRRRFAIHAFSYGSDRDDAARRRLRAAVDHFDDVRALGDIAAAERARQAGIDIAVDLKGLTYEGRPGIFAAGAAPLQAGWLGYPGTLGAPLLDYLIADRQVIPPGQRPHHVEHILYLPDCYQPNDDRRAIAAPPTRRAMGLPEQGFVFACFNASFKIGPAEFDIWMRLLRAVEGSVIWLLGGEPRAEANLRAEAAKRGIAPQRLVFAAPLPNAAHLGRLALADLFLDCFAYNAHTTASDALWAGRPLVTLPGEGFAARVASSLLKAAGLPELIAQDTAHYEAIALDLAQDRRKLAAIGDRLAAGRSSCPLFDTAGFTANLEAGYEAIHARFRAGLPPADLDITP